jgi:hydroxyethylthiazole kinase-like uncharacterized protein yjeF
MGDNKSIDREFVRTVIKSRNRYAHKGNFGRVLLVAGHGGMTGAAIFASRAAMRSGSGLVYTCTAKAAFPVIETAVPEVICTEWDEAMNRITTGDSYDAVAFGPGMGVSAQTKRMLKTLLLSYDGPLVLDADGLNVLAKEPDMGNFARAYNGELILTPHVGEARRLLETDVFGNPDGREEMVMRLAEKYNAVALLKGADTLVAKRDDDGPEIWQNTSGNPGMATAGAGDVLTGVITSLAGQGLTAWEAARAGAFIHGAAGDLACGEKGEYGLIASDIAEDLPYVFKSIVNS